jgi:hypothetical protein
MGEHLSDLKAVWVKRILAAGITAFDSTAVPANNRIVA